KTFTAKRKPAGLLGSLKAIVRPEHVDVQAVSGLSFEMEEGELLGFIGPNGAGKSTTIKILTGILHPSGGEAEVLGFVPWRDRRRLAYQIGTVFGQRSQLWPHLPAIDTLHLFGAIYDLDRRTTERRIAELAEAFEITHLLETPVRKLSLGQRMRCEVAASLLHQPRLILLDEPSIGLDPVAKARIREMIKRMNAEEGVGVLLTSHDAGDIEALCKRVIVVNHGQIVYDDRVSALKRRFLTVKDVGVRFAEPVAGDVDIPGAEVVKVGGAGYGLKLRFDTQVTAVESILAHIGALGGVEDMTISDPSLEDVIRVMYEQAAAGDLASATEAASAGATSAVGDAAGATSADADADADAEAATAGGGHGAA
ncbi:MAG: ATP-binding cassette domain-containing protein, partial [Ardenticatenales bacterium]